ncbi:potassium channel family protein [Helicobacter burdigaliensis]|uniref:potassium channel family protein n=1 Tax=Helicobacter burdigaliensis TaxID=2315334 RepID=UPI000EF6997C|nr:TrkA family potassium uptake protein [Helicobacter burdigaliensis]
MQTYGVIGLGKFGYYIASGLIKQGKRVLIADKDEAVVREFADLSEMAFVLDSTDTLALKEAGFSNIDFAIISIGENIESSILTLMALKELEVKNIIAKAITPIHGKILSRLGASKVIYPEKEASQHLLRSFIAHPEFELVDVSNSLKIIKIKINSDNVGMSGNDLLNKIVAKKEIEHAKIIAIKKDGDKEWDLSPDINQTLFENTKVVVFGFSEALEKFSL